MAGQVDDIHSVLVIPPKDAGSRIVGKMKVHASRQLRLRYPDLRRIYWRTKLCLLDFSLRLLG
ncbi:MAG: transposase [Nitrospirales bacterium]|nr:transposase [Nitrospirales bacterium]